MELPINRDPQQLNKSVFAGKKRWQWICIITAIVIAVIFTIFSKLNSTLNGLICMVLAAPLSYIAVYSRNGLDFFEYHKKKKAGKVFFWNRIPACIGKLELPDSEDNSHKASHSRSGKVAYVIKNIVTGGKYTGGNNG